LSRVATLVPFVRVDACQRTCVPNVFVRFRSCTSSRVSEVNARVQHSGAQHSARGSRTVGGEACCACGPHYPGQTEGNQRPQAALVQRPIWQRFWHQQPANPFRNVAIQVRTPETARPWLPSFFFWPCTVGAVGWRGSQDSRRELAMGACC